MAILGQITVKFLGGRVRIHKSVDHEGELHMQCAGTDRSKPYILCKKPFESVIRYDTEYMTTSQARKLVLDAAVETLVDDIALHTSKLGEAYAARLDIIDRLSAAKTKGKLKEKAPVLDAADTVVVVVDCSNMGQVPFLL